MSLSREDIRDLIEHYPTRSAKLVLRSGDEIRLPRVRCLGERRIPLRDIDDVKLLPKRRFER